jgi:hypothetical protein
MVGTFASRTSEYTHSPLHTLVQQAPATGASHLLETPTIRTGDFGELLPATLLGRQDPEYVRGSRLGCRYGRVDLPLLGYLSHQSPFSRPRLTFTH